MKFFVDECLSHRYVERLAARGYPDSFHPIHIGWRGTSDQAIVEKCLLDDRIIITSNGRDFRKLLARASIHSGLIVIADSEFATGWKLIEIALSFIEMHPIPSDWMVNRVIEVSADEGLLTRVLPEIPSAAST